MDDAAPLWKLCPENLEALKPARAMFDLTCAMNCPLARGASPSWEKRGALGGHGTYSKRFLSALTAHVHAPGALATAMDTPFLKGSVFEDGTVRIIWDGDDIEGMNSTQLLVRLMLGSKDQPVSTVNLPHLRKPANAVVVDASKLSLSDREEWEAASSMWLSTSQVIGSLGFLSCLPMYLLIPHMTL